MEIQPDILRQIYRRTVDVCMELINQDQRELVPVCVMFSVIDDKPCHIGVFPPEVMLEFHTNEDTKLLLMHAINELLSGRGPEDLPNIDIVVHVSEAWAKTFKLDDPAGTEAFDRFERGLDSVRDMDGRQEIVLIAIHTAAGTYTGLLPITTSEDGRRHVEFSELDLGSLTNTTGRMTMNSMRTKH